MAKLTWDEVGERYYETGVNKGVLYPFNSTTKTYGDGVAWNGLTAVNESPDGAEATALYADNIKYLNLISAEEFNFTIEAYYSPEEFDVCDGSASIAPGVKIGQQKRQMFGFSYQTRIGNDTDASDYGYKIHLVYGCLASPTDRDHNTINDSPEAETLSWECSTTPVDVTIDGVSYKPTAHLVIDSTTADATKLAALEDILYGTTQGQPTLPLPAVVASTLA